MWTDQFIVSCGRPSIGRRGVYWGHQINFRSNVLGRFKIGFCVHIDFYINFYIIVNLFLSEVELGLVIRSGEHLVCFGALYLVVSLKKFSNETVGLLNVHLQFQSD